ncbi:MAG: class I SAM-dependent methyltransferase [Pirellulales bacterium]
MSSWYDLPRYYEIGMQDETAEQAAFVRAAVARYATVPVRSLVEPACGPGALARALARDFHVSAFDLNPRMIEYARRRSGKSARPVDWFVGDMTDFRLPAPVDGAYCLLDSFRHLTTEAAAAAHLRAVAANVRVGGVYLLGFHLVPPDADPNCTERWTQTRGRTTVTTTFRVLSASRKTRLERIRVSTLVREKPDGRIVKEHRARRVRSPPLHRRANQNTVRRRPGVGTPRRLRFLVRTRPPAETDQRTVGHGLCFATPLRLGSASPSPPIFSVSLHERYDRNAHCASAFLICLYFSQAASVTRGPPSEFPPNSLI